MIRNKMADARRKEEQAAEKDAIIVRKQRPVRQTTKEGYTLTHAKDVPPEMVQDDMELVVIGADVVSLYPSMTDIEVANLCYEAVMKSSIKFSNINYRKARLYIATNMNKTDQRLSPLWRVLPRRTSKGGVRPGVTASPDQEENWYFPEVELTELEKKMIMATVIKIGVIVMMNSHVYSFNGETFLQKAGGPIGLRSTCAVARVVMNEWDARWMKLVKANNVNIKKNNRYMDDIRAMLKALREGWRWFEGSLCHTKEWEAEDKESGISAAGRTGRGLVAMMNEIFPFLKFTTELGEHFKDGKLPSLDTNIWVKDNLTILFEFFGKTMASNVMVQADSALSKEVKLASLSEEITRRLRNTSLEVERSRRLEILEEACTRMKTSGHSEDFIRTAVTKGIRNFNEKVRRSQLPTGSPGYLPLYQGSNWRKNERSKEKAMKRKTWYMDGKKDNSKRPSQKIGNKKRKVVQKAGKIPTTTVVFVPNTKGGILVKKLKEKEDSMSDITGFRIRFQEAGGSQLKNMFNTDLAKGKHCGRTPCPPCDGPGENKDNCRSRNLVYESCCTVCNPCTKASRRMEEKTPRSGVYIGETSRSIHERTVEHMRDVKSFSHKSHIVKHWVREHPDMASPPPFQFKILTRYKDALSRQIGEALKIFYSEDKILNSKSEYLDNCISRLSIEETPWEKKEREKQEDEQDWIDKEEVEKFRKEVEGRKKQDG